MYIYPAEIHGNFMRNNNSKLKSSGDFLLNNILMNIPVPYQSLDSKGYIRDVNRHWLKTLKYSRKDVIDHHFTEFIGLEYKLNIQKCFRLFKKNNTVENVEIEMLRKDGKRIFALFCGKIEWDKRGRFLETHCIFQDITEHKRTEAALRKSEEQYRSVIDNMDDVFYRTDKAGRIIMVSPSAIKMLGYTSVNEIIGRSVRKFWAHPRDREKMMMKIEVAGHVTDYEVSILKKDNSPLRVSVTSKLLRDDRGDVRGVEGIIRDISDRKMAEESLHESELHYRNLFESTKDSIFVVDQTTGNFISANSSASELYGYPPEEFAHMNIRDVSAEPAKTLAAVRRGSTFIASRFHRKKDGTIFPVEITGSYFKLKNRKIHTAFIRDVTDRKRMEDERETTLEFLRIINSTTGFSNLIKDAATFFQQKSGCEAFGIRLKEGDDYPYYEARGFSEKFVKMESSLCAHDSSGALIRDQIGNPVLACMCGNIICGRFDISKPFFTQNGSFWTNSTTELLASTSEADRQARTRNRCHGEGYESVALIPLTFGGDRLGLIQLNDRRKGMFTLEFIALWERLAGYLGVALAKAKAEESLRISEAHLINALKIAHLGHWEYNIAKDLFTFNDQFYKIFQTTAEEMGGYTMSSSRYAELFIHPEDRHLVRDETRNAVKATDPHYSRQLEHRFINAEGKIGYLCVRFNIIKDDQGRTIKTYGANQDITDRKTAEQNIHEYQKQLKTLVHKLVLKEDRERRRIASDLHDRISQNLFIAKLKLGEFQNVLTQKSDSGTLDEVSRLIEKTILDTRSLIYDLSPPILYELGLGASLVWLADDLKKAYGLKVDMHVSKLPKELSESKNIVIFRSVRELLMNVVKHANVQIAKVLVRYQNRKLVKVQVADSGSGFDVSGVYSMDKEHGFGIFNLREQIERLGGTILIESYPGHGTSVTLQIPVK